MHLYCVHLVQYGEQHCISISNYALHFRSDHTAIPRADTAQIVQGLSHGSVSYKAASSPAMATPNPTPAPAAAPVVAAAEADAALAEEALAAERLAETDEAMDPVEAAELEAAAPDAVEEAARVEEPDAQTGAVLTLMFAILQSVTANCVVADHCLLASTKRRHSKKLCRSLRCFRRYRQYQQYHSCPSCCQSMFAIIIFSAGPLLDRVPDSYSAFRD
jgi:hypothetical protein